MRVFLLISALLVSASVAVASPVRATVTITGNCTQHQLVGGEFIPVYSTNSPCGTATGWGEITPYGFWASSDVGFGSWQTGLVDIWTSMALEVVVLGGTGSGFISGFTRGDILFIEDAPGGDLDFDWTFASSFGLYRGPTYDLFMYPFIFGEPILYTVDTHFSAGVDTPRDGWGRRAFWLSMHVLDIRDAQGNIADGAYFAEAAASPEPSVGLLSGFALLLLMCRIKRRPNPPE